MEKRFIKILFLFILLLGFLFSTSNQIQAQSTNVKVGLLTPMTGGLSAYSLGFEQGAQLAIDHLNNEPNINSTYSFSLTKYDTKTDPTGASAAMTQAVTDGMDYVVGAAGSSNTLAAAAVAVTNTVPLISYASSSPWLTTFDDHAVLGDEGYLWRIPPSDALQGEVIADLAYDGNYTKMVIVAIDYAYGTGLAASTKDEFEIRGGSATVITYSQSAVDFSTIVSQIVSEEPDIIVALSFATDGARLFVEMANQHLNIPVIGADGVADVAIFGEHVDVQNAMQGFITLTPISANTSEAQAFAEAYNNAFGDTVGHIFSAEAYDAVWAGALAIVATGSVAGEDIITGLASISWAGASGPVSFDINGDSKAGFYQISEVQLDQMIRVGTWNTTNALVYEDITFHDRWISKSDQSSVTTILTIVTTTEPIDTPSEITSTITITPTSIDENTSTPNLNLPFPIFGLIVSIIISTNFIRYKRRKWQ